MFSGVQKKKSSKSVLALIAISALSHATAAFAQAPAGGAIGNAKYVPYESKLLKLSTVYPDTWDHLDVGSGVTFLEPQAEAGDANPAASVHIDQQGLSNVQTLAELEQYLKFFQPGFAWEPTALNGVKGFRASAQGQSAQYFLRAAGDVISVAYKETDSAAAQERIGKIVGSLELK